MGVKCWSRSLFSVPKHLQHRPYPSQLLGRHTAGAGAALAMWARKLNRTQTRELETAYGSVLVTGCFRVNHGYLLEIFTLVCWLFLNLEKEQPCFPSPKDSSWKPPTWSWWPCSVSGFDVKNHSHAILLR